MTNRFNFELYLAVLIASILGCCVATALLLVARCPIGLTNLIFDIILVVVWPLVAGFLVDKL